MHYRTDKPKVFVTDSGRFVADCEIILLGRKIICTGTDLQYEIAVAKAKSELAERIAFASPDAFNARVTRVARRLMLEATNAFNRESVTLPLSLFVTRPHLCWIRGNNSTGFAAHPRRKAAIEHAVNEVLERGWNARFRRDQQSLLKLATIRRDGSTAWVHESRLRQVSYCLANARVAGHVGWGSAVRRTTEAAVEAATSEAHAMSASGQDYGRGGTGVSELLSQHDQIAFVERQPVRIDDVTHYVIQAVNYS
ncbi:hypothetical protein CO665_30785 [Rhizobium anhuiense]|uniref:YcaO-like family protein n=1 Tax=Rhizobium anhuiense TaxID=1184720 RepID=UPI000BEABAA1|nr:YcaO-like family protein [Rhizobium anhuiense]PDS34422.1 hypothetical protein CO665_30785 [Rhizobium anhuiense]